MPLHIVESWNKQHRPNHFQPHSNSGHRRLLITAVLRQRTERGRGLRRREMILMCRTQRRNWQRSVVAALKTRRDCIRTSSSKKKGRDGWRAVHQSQVLHNQLMMNVVYECTQVPSRVFGASHLFVWLQRRSKNNAHHTPRLILCALAQEI